jgi:hypothetical protein
MSELAAITPTPNAAKRLVTLTAQFALRGFEVRQVPDGFGVKRWNLDKLVPDLNSLERFARVVEAA